MINNTNRTVNVTVAPPRCAACLRPCIAGEEEIVPCAPSTDRVCVPCKQGTSESRARLLCPQRQHLPLCACVEQAHAKNKLVVITLSSCLTVYTHFF